MNWSSEKFTNVNLSQRLAFLIKEDGRNQKVIAAEAGISEGALSNYLKGRVPGLKEVCGLAKALKMSPAQLMGWDAIRDEERSVLHVADALAEQFGGTEPERERLFNEYAALLFDLKSVGRDLFRLLDALESKTKALSSRLSSSSADREGKVIVRGAGGAINYVQASKAAAALAAGEEQGEREHQESQRKSEAGAPSEHKVSPSASGATESKATRVARGRVPK